MNQVNQIDEHNKFPNLLKLSMLFCMFLGVTALLSGCTQVPKGVTPIQNFKLERYLGKWYEIARLDHSFERGLTQVSAKYSMREDGGVRVINSGISSETNQSKIAEGKAYFIGSENIGSLKVSFFGPFYGGYHIAKLDPNYQMALVIGPNTDYAWILSRTKQPGLVECKAYYQAAEGLGIKRSDWIEGYACK